MSKKNTAEPFEPQSHAFELLPESFVIRRRVRKVLFGWSIVLIAIFAVLCGVTVSFVVRGQQIKQRHAHLIATALPLVALRDSVQAMKHNTENAEKLSDVIESSMPDDSLLQVLAAVAAATQPEVNPIDVISIDVKLPLEYPTDKPMAPVWAQSRLVVLANTQDGKAANQWIQRINESDRVDAAVLSATTERSNAPNSTERSPLQTQSPQQSGVFGQRPGNRVVQISAEPIATRVLP